MISFERSTNAAPALQGSWIPNAFYTSPWDRCHRQNLLPVFIRAHSVSFLTRLGRAYGHDAEAMKAMAERLFEEDKWTTSGWGLVLRNGRHVVTEGGRA